MLAVVKYLTNKTTIVSSCCFNVSRRILCIKKKTNYSKVPNPPTTYLHRSAIINVHEKAELNIFAGRAQCMEEVV